jgi:hypothetical protein
VVVLVVPEQGLVTITPEKLGGSNVLVVVLSGQFIVGLSGVSSSVSKMIGLLLVDPSSSDSKNGSNNKDGNFLPELSGTLGVRNSLLLELDESLAGSRVSGVVEGAANLGVRLGRSETAESSLGSGGSGGSDDGARKHDCWIDVGDERG